MTCRGSTTCVRTSCRSCTRPGTDMRLPRETMVEYVQPCFEAQVRAQSVVWKEPHSSSAHHSPESSAGGGGDGGGNRITKSRSDDLSWCVVGSVDVFNSNRVGDDGGKDKQKRKTKREWEDIWLIIRHETMTLCACNISRAGNQSSENHWE